MKKVVKGLVIAASVAAVVGLGAVSFAQWQGTGSKEVTSSGATGEVTLVGFAGASATAWTGKLVPYDQPTSTITEGNVTVVSITLPAVTAVSGQTITVAADFTYNNSGSATAGKYNKLYVIAQSSGEAPSANDIVTGAKEVTSSGVPISDITSGTYTLYFALDSNDTAAMNGSYNITVTLSDPT
ncbi:MAG: hypothetical protein J1F33_05905 [Clostridiales bacterium]|nr:hypothetical protein [Clostridiales bacterium]